VTLALLVPLLGAVFLASLLGSLHCMGMCGGFVALYAAPDPVSGPTGGPGSGGRGWRGHLAYNGGRLLTYTLVGALAGLLGGLLDMGGQAALGVGRGAAVVAGLVMLAGGGLALARARGVPLGPQVERLPGLGRIARLAGRALSAAQRQPARRRALVTGLLTPLLPCGWLYLFAVTAAGTGSALVGAVVLAVFWAGTVPALVATGVGLQGVLAPLRRHAGVLTGVTLLVVGGLTIAQRGLPVLVGAVPAVVDAEASAARVEIVDQETLPCCADEQPGPGDPR
jgi:uncharacterized protein